MMQKPAYNVIELPHPVGPRHCTHVDQIRFSWDQFLAFASENWREMNYSRHYHYRETFKEAHADALKGWPEGLANARRIESAIAKSLTGQIARPEFHYQDTPGMDFDLGLVLSGEIEHWGNIAPIGSDRTCRIVLNCSISGAVTPAAIINRGATVAALVQLLEQGGTRCEVVVMDATANFDGRIIECYVTVKAPGSDLDLDRITFALAHPDMERWLMFSAEPRTHAGHPCECLDQGDIYLPSALFGAGCNWNDSESCISWVRDILAKQGVLTA